MMMNTTSTNIASTSFTTTTGGQFFDMMMRINIEGYEGLVIGFLFGLMTLTVTGLLECLPSSISTVRGLWATPGGKKLYGQSIMMNVFNNLVLGTFTYHLATIWFIQGGGLLKTKYYKHHPFSQLNDNLTSDDATSRGYLYPNVANLTSPTTIYNFCGLVAAHCVGYWFCHRLMHRPYFYVWTHKFHHKFDKYIMPSSSNAVTVSEFALAYMVPFVIGGLALGQIDATSLFAASSWISLTNLLIHTPGLEELSGRILPWWVVSTKDHIEHHRDLKSHYAAPTINLDKIIKEIAIIWKKFSNAAFNNNNKEQTKKTHTKSN